LRKSLDKATRKRLLIGRFQERDARQHNRTRPECKPSARLSLDVWFERLEIGGRLPDVPLFLKDGPCLKVALGQTYRRVCRQSRLLEDLQSLETAHQAS
jgi:hypothetical protein